MSYEILIKQIEHELTEPTPLICFLDKEDFWEDKDRYDLEILDQKPLENSEYWERSINYMLIILESLEQ